MKMKSFVGCIGVMLFIFAHITSARFQNLNVWQVFPNQNKVLRNLGIIIENCFNIKMGVSLLIGDWNTEENLLFKYFFSSGTPLVLINSNNHRIFEKHKLYGIFNEINETIVSQKNSPATNITIIIRSDVHLRTLLTKLRESIWWNHQAFFFIVNISKNGCGLANIILRVVWNFNILFAVYLCINSDNKITLYSFNPYTHLAPSFWNTRHSQKNEIWTLLEHVYNNSINTFDLEFLQCHNLNFDKAKNVNGHNIKMGAYNASSLLKNENTLVNPVFDKINANASCKYYPSFGFMNGSEPQGIFKDIMIGNITFVSNAMFLRSFWKIQTYPYNMNGLCIVTLNQRISNTNRFISIFTPRFWLCLFLACLVLIVTIKAILKISILKGALEFLRIFTNSSTLREPQYTFTRGCYIIILQLILVFNSYFQSRLSALQTVPDYSLNIDSGDDLIKSGLKIYGEKHHKELLIHAGVCDRFQEIKDISECLKILKSGKPMACIPFCSEVKSKKNYNKSTYDLHISKTNLLNLPTAYITSPDWPLYSKINNHLGHFIESGIPTFMQKNHELPSLENIQTENEFKKVSMEQLSFGFIMLLGSYILTILTLFLEIVVYKSKIVIKYKFFIRS